MHGRASANDDRVLPEGTRFATGPKDDAENAGLVHVSDDAPGIRRLKRGKHFRYCTPDGRPVEAGKTLERISRLAIPPAWTDVWICTKSNGHLQATGRDAKGRKQYRYHERFRAARDSTKYDHILAFAEALPGIRATLARHMALPGLPREKVLATIVELLDTTMIRVGNADYAAQNKSYGLTTLRNRHVAVTGSELRFAFRGKSGKQWRLSIRDRRIARIVKAIQDLPGQHLFQYLDAEGSAHAISSGDINAYLKDISGADITAKDFRTWNGTVLVAHALVACEKADSETAARRNVRSAIECVAARLGNTPTICRKCYVHPQIVDSYLGETLVLDACDELAGFSPEEAIVLAFLKRTLRACGQ